MNNRLGGCLVLAMLLSVLVGCGQKGDLYLPDESDNKQDFGTRAIEQSRVLKQHA